MIVGVDPLSRQAHARVGQVLRGKWRLDRLLGVGGMASVYAGTHRNGKRGAVKVLHRELSTDPSIWRRFLREGYVANKVEHPGAVSVLDDDTAEDGSVFLVMELLEGETLEARAASRPGGVLAPPEVVFIALELLSALGAAHHKGVVHRDLKPENVFLTREGRIKVLDFGIARLRDKSSPCKTTTAGSVMGSPSFMPPEQALGNSDAIDGRTDLWALGATMFTLLTGRAVHEANNVNQLLLAAMTRPAPPIGSVMPAIDPGLASVIDRALAFDQKARFEDAASMQQALRGIDVQPGARITIVVPTSDRPERIETSQTVAVKSLVGGDTATVKLPSSKKFAFIGPIAAGVVLVVGIGTGFVFATRSSSPATQAGADQAAPSSTSVAAGMEPATSPPVQPLPPITPAVSASAPLASAQPVNATPAVPASSRLSPIGNPVPTGARKKDPLGKW